MRDYTIPAISGSITALFGYASAIDFMKYEGLKQATFDRGNYEVSAVVFLGVALIGLGFTIYSACRRSR